MPSQPPVAGSTDDRPPDHAPHREPWISNRRSRVNVVESVSGSNPTRTRSIQWLGTHLLNAGVGGLCLPKVLKNTTNMFSKYNTVTGTFGLGMKLYTI
jgi:hypothetical protein